MKSKRSEVKSRSSLSCTLAASRYSRILLQSLAAARRTETTACPVDLAAINPAGSSSAENYFDGRPLVTHYTLYNNMYVRRFQNKTAWLIDFNCNSMQFQPAR